MISNQDEKILKDNSAQCHGGARDRDGDKEGDGDNSNDGNDRDGD